MLILGIADMEIGIYSINKKTAPVFLSGFKVLGGPGDCLITRYEYEKAFLFQVCT